MEGSESESEDIKVDIERTLTRDARINLPSSTHKLKEPGPPVIKEEVLENANLSDASDEDGLPIPTNFKIEIGEVSLVKQESLNKDLIINSDDNDDNSDEDEDEARTTYLDYPDVDSNPPSEEPTPRAKYEWTEGSKTYTMTKEMHDEISDSALEKCLSIITPSNSYGLRNRRAKESFRCPTCRRYYSSQSNLANHSAPKTCKALHQVPERRYICPRCQKEFPQAHRLKMHLITIHFNIKGHHRCLACNKKFGTQSGFASHQYVNCQQRTDELSEEESDDDMARARARQRRKFKVRVGYTPNRRFVARPHRNVKRTT